MVYGKYSWKRYRFVLMIVLVVILQACQGYKNVLIDENVKGIGYGPCESSICVNPANTDNIVVGSVIDKVYYSVDGGKTWEKNKLTSSYGIWGDPCIVADKKGSMYYFHLSIPSGKPAWDSDKLDRMVCQKSLDGGKTWSDGSYTGLNTLKDQDKEWAAVDYENNNVYLTWTQFDAYASDVPTNKTNILFSKSTDGGEHWSQAKRINQFSGDCVDDDQTVEGAVPTVGPQGEVYVAWSYDNKIYFDKSTDYGESWMPEDKVVADQPGGWAINIPGIGRANGMPVTGCDISKSSPYKGNIYVNWADQKNGEDDTDIWLSKSNDGGNTWSAPLRINDDVPGKHQFFSWMSVDPVTGYIYIIFYDRRNHEDNHTDVYMAWSKDGGATFINEKISKTPFLVSPGIFFGDYNNISAYNGVVRPVWTRQDGKKLSIYTALIRKK